MSRCTVAGSCRFLSTLSLRRATLSKDAKDGPVLISLHALLTESDAKLTQKFEIRSKFLSTLSLRRATKRVQVKARLLQISIHALLTESDSKWSILKSRRMVFLSTLSLRRATDDVCGCRRYGGNFYPRSPYGERRVLYCHLIPSNDFYPRSPYGERRCGSGYQAGPEINFYPRSPYGERRHGSADRRAGGPISIHALLTESDRALIGERQRVTEISIHALLTESDKS